MHEAEYVHDGALQRQAVLDLLWYEDTGLLAWSAAFIIALLVMVYSESLRVPAATIFGFSLAYFVSVIWQVAAATRLESREQVIRLTEDGLEASSFVGDARYHWSAVRCVDLTRRFVFLIVGDRRLTLPRSALSTEAVEFVVKAAAEAGAKVRGKV